MFPDIRPLADGEHGAFVEALEMAAGRHVDAETLADGRRVYRPDRTLVAFDGNRIVGGTAWEPVELTVPGPTALPAAKITLTGLLPGYRRQGLASAFMRRQLYDLRAGGRPLAVLTTSQSGVPGRHGFSPATLAMAVEVTPRRRTPATGSELRTRLLDRTEAESILPAVYDRHRHAQSGQVSRSPGFWQHWFMDRPLPRIGTSDRFFVVADDSTGTCQGYLTYRLNYGPLRELPVSELAVEDLIAVTDEARRELWGYCLDFDQAPLVSAWNVPADEPLRWMLGPPEDVRVTGLRDFTRLRLVDVPAALAARRYPASGELVLQIADAVLASNAGRYRLVGDLDGAACAATDEAADLSLSVAELAALYLGGIDSTRLARAGRVVEHTRGALRRADAMFAWRPGPWTVTDW
jgi:predicted acetyltransferase